MKNMPSDKYNVAWFKLAECVSRGEKERALGVYRLLAHSLNDPAFARQLQGDILIAFNDPSGAVEHYKAAARLYQESERYLETAALYEHIVTLSNDKKHALKKLVEVYLIMKHEAKIIMHANALCVLLLAHNEIEEAWRVLQDIHHIISSDETVSLQQQVIFTLLEKKTVALVLIMPSVTQVLDILLEQNNSQALQRFVATLETLNEECYTATCRYLQEHEGL